jgi:hypothetical protein
LIPVTHRLNIASADNLPLMASAGQEQCAAIFFPGGLEK